MEKGCSPRQRRQHASPRDDSDTRSRIDCNAASGTVKLVEPQSRHTTMTGNTKAGDVFRFLMPVKWMAISALNSTVLVDWHDWHCITYSPLRLTCKY
jgi:hypothetical protein